MQGLLTVLTLMTLGVAAAVVEEDASMWRKEGMEQLRRALARGRDVGRAKNVVLFIGDGMGLATVTAAGILKGGEGHLLTWERFPIVGLAKTYSTDHMVPDSAATATAFLSGSKTRTKMLGLDSSTPLGRCDKALNAAATVTTLANWAQEAGKHAGVVSTARITHATPAALYSHINHRDWECDGEVANHSVGCVVDIARQLVEQLPGKELRVVLGGGRRQLGASDATDPDEDDSCVRHDGRNLAAEWSRLSGGRRVYVNNTEQLMRPGAVDGADYLLGLFSGGHMAYEAERDRSPKGQPSLANMTRQALRVLKRNPNGFFLLVEGGRVDMAHHKNYARLALLEAIQLEEAVATAFEEVNIKETLVIVTADHSHVMTINGYPRRGTDVLGITTDNDDDEENVAYETLSYANGPGAKVHSGRPILSFSEDKRKSLRYQHDAGLYTGNDETHAGEDVPVYSIGPGSTLLSGVYEQSYLATAMAYAAGIGEFHNKNNVKSLKSSLPGAAEPHQQSSPTIDKSGAAALSATATLLALVTLRHLL